MTELASHGASTPGALRIQCRIDAEGVVLALEGDLDLASTPSSTDSSGSCTRRILGAY
jgi:hypothetical protein